VVKDQVRDFTELNGRLRQQCVEDGSGGCGTGLDFSIRFWLQDLASSCRFEFRNSVKNAGISRRHLLSLHSFAF